MQKQINLNQLNLFDNTYHGERPVKFYGKYIKNETDQNLYRNQAEIILRDFCNGDFWTKKEWILNTGFTDADRILRHIANGKYAGYKREVLKKEGEHFARYRIVKL